MRMPQETTSVEDEEGSRRGRENEFFWLELTAKEWQKGKEKAGVFSGGDTESKDGACPPCGWLHAIISQ